MLLFTMFTAWMMVFKVIANVSSQNVAELWGSNHTLSENVSSALDITTAHSGQYKNRVVLQNNWKTFNATEVRKTAIL